MDDLDALDRIHDLCVESNDGVDRPTVDGFTMTGALVIGLYVRPDGYAATFQWSYGQMHAYAKEGVLRSLLRSLESDPGESDDA